LATWFAIVGETQAWVAVLMWSLPVVNSAWSWLTRKHDRVYADIGRTLVFLPVSAAIYAGAIGPMHHLRIPALVMAVGGGVVRGRVSRSPALGCVSTVANCLALGVGAGLWGEPLTLELLVDVLPVTIAGLLLAIVAAKLGGSLAEARRRRV